MSEPEGKAKSLYLRQYQPERWVTLTANEKQALLLEAEKLAAEAERTLLRNEPSHVVALGKGFTYMWDLAP